MGNLKQWEFNGITEFKNELKSSDIKIWIYNLPVRDLSKKHDENYKVVRNLKMLNKDNSIIVFNENIIGSFDEIKNWGYEKYKTSEYRTINCNISTERKLLERMLLQEIKNSIDKNLFELRNQENNSVYLKKPLLQKDNVILKRKINFDINIKEENIIVGFDMSHGYDYINTLQQDLNKIKKGDKVKDFYYSCYFEFVQVADFTISEHNKYMQTSIVEYYKNKNQSYIVDKLDKNTKAVLVANKNNEIFPYIPNRLKRVCHFGNLPSNVILQCDKFTKLDADNKMQNSINLTRKILENSRYTNFFKKNMLVEQLGYEKQILNNPKFVFGNDKRNSNVIKGLLLNGCYEKEKLEIHYFIANNLRDDNNKFEKIKKFSNELERFSQERGVKLLKQTEDVDLKSIDINNKVQFECELRKIVDKYKNPVIVIMERKHCDEYYGTIKKIFGHQHQIATQFIYYETLNYNEKNKPMIFLNILLGIYGKGGVQPWVLDTPLSANCYIGLDVSRENKLNTVGVIQIVGKDGRVLKSKSITSPQQGEKINTETIKEILQEAKVSYEKNYNEELKHVVIHRDGRNMEEVEDLKEIANNLGIKFEYIEITKNVNRRISNFDKNKKCWQTEIGSCYIKDDFAYMVTTSPHSRIGMANPLRIKKVYGEQSIKQIVEDVYKLSFMHVGSIIKCRLPVTTHYADLSSTYGNRQWMPANIDSKVLHFI